MTSRDNPLHAAQPEVASALNRMQAVAREATDPALLELCRQRVSELLDDGDPIPPSRLLTPAERAFLAFTDQFVFSVASVSDDDVAKLLEHAEPVDVYRFVAALYSVEMSLRIDIVGRSVLGQQEVLA
jgi:alkylhydroperoxidase family enzyme